MSELSDTDGGITVMFAVRAVPPPDAVIATVCGALTLAAAVAAKATVEALAGMVTLAGIASAGLPPVLRATVSPPITAGADAVTVQDAAAPGDSWEGAQVIEETDTEGATVTTVLLGADVPTAAVTVTV